MPQESVDYSKTVLLPETAFPMKASLAVNEPLRLKAWEESGAYARLRQRKRGAPRWLLHDGPPFANGDIHMGTALNKVLKDVFIRYKTQRGFDAPYVPGWDTHGMPIEFKVSRELKGKPISPLELRRLCRAEAEKWVDKQRQQFKRLGVWGDWEHPYITMDPAFESGQLDAYWALLSRGQVYRALKPVHWSWATQTALAEAELEYQEKTSTQVYVKYPLSAESAAALGADKAKPAFAVIWTTTPWTLPASLAITANERFDYALYEVGKELWLMAAALAGNVFETLPEVRELAGGDRSQALLALAEAKVWEGKGAALETLKARHPFLDRDIRFCLAPYVTADAGTGLVHTAPGHGAEDYVTGVRYKLDIFCPVDERGCYTEAVQPAELKGMRVTDPATDQAVLALLGPRLVHSVAFKHSYPHDWRSKQPVIFRATRQWFMSLTANGLRETVLDETSKVAWINPWGRERFGNMMKDRADWCISRQRTWGVPIYMFYCLQCGAEHFDEACYRKLKPIVAEHGGDAWYDPARPLADFLPRGAACKECGSVEFRKETDTLDVWFDSGSSSISVLKARADQSFPADLYLEGSDQYRGWFQSSMLVSCAVAGQAPYRSVLSTGWTLDAQGRAMHKSAGNAVDPLKVMDQSGADVLRLWVASEDCTADMTVSDELFKAVAENYRRLRNSFRWLLGNLSDFDPARDAVPLAQMAAFDRWLLSRLDSLVEGFTAEMEAYQLHKAFSRLQAFCAGELSSLAFDVHKDTLYTFAAGHPQRRSAQTAFHQVLQTLLRLAAPVLCFTADEAWERLPAGQRGPVEGEGVHFSDWPLCEPARRDAGLEEDFRILIELVRPTVSKKLEEARAAKLIGHPYDAEVTLSVHSKKILRLLHQHKDFLPQLFVVSRVSLGNAAPQDGLVLGPDEVRVEPTQAIKCARCWRRPGDVVEEGGVCGRCAGALNHG
ncbi:MAG TPA: isoleucine--tRNA ligase [bacterium]|jgi:isoleucyl-tRNA synthetase|nr:isoleucine--tRNA ligase [bacterium]